MGTELTWVAIAASLLMGLGAAMVFVFAVTRDYFRDIEDAKFHVFWSDLEDAVDASSTPHGITDDPPREDPALAGR
jgi:hypothetical protein